MATIDPSKIDDEHYKQLALKARTDAQTAEIARDLAHVTASIAVKLGASASDAANAIGGPAVSDDERRGLRLKYQSIQGRGRRVTRELARRYDKGIVLMGMEPKIDWERFNDPTHRSTLPTCVEDLLHQAGLLMRLHRFQPATIHLLGIEEATLNWLISEAFFNITQNAAKLEELDKQIQLLRQDPRLLNARRATRRQLQALAAQLGTTSRERVALAAKQVQTARKLRELLPHWRDNSVRWAVFNGGSPSEIADKCGGRYSVRSVYKLRRNLGVCGVSPAADDQAQQDLQRIQRSCALMETVERDELVFISLRLAAIETESQIQKLIKTQIWPALAL